MQQRFVYFVVILLLNGCLSSMPPKTQSELENLSFMDTDVFDKALLESMSANIKNINVAITGDVSINSIPTRLSKWLSVVVEKDGHVDVTPKTTKALISLSALLGVLPPAYYFLKEELSYGAARNYNATIFYQPATGLIDQVVFRKKE